MVSGDAPDRSRICSWPLIPNACPNPVPINVQRRVRNRAAADLCVKHCLEFQPHHERSAEQRAELGQIRHDPRDVLPLPRVANAGHLHVVLARQGEDDLAELDGIPTGVKKVRVAGAVSVPGIGLREADPVVEVEVDGSPVVLLAPERRWPPVRHVRSMQALNHDLKSGSLALPPRDELGPGTDGRARSGAPRDL